MSNKIDVYKLIKENPAAVYSSIAAIAALVVYLILFAPLLKQLGVKYAECRTCESRLWDARNTIDYARNIDSMYGTRVLISEKDAAAGIEELTKFGKSLGINFSEIHPSDIVYTPGAAYKILPLEVNLEASGEQFVKFMGSVDELKKAIIRMKSFNIIPDKDAKNSLNVHMVLEIYLSPKADSSG